MVGDQFLQFWIYINRRPPLLWIFISSIERQHIHPFDTIPRQERKGSIQAVDMSNEKDIIATQREDASSPAGEKVVDVKFVQGSEALAAALIKEPPRPWAKNSILLYACCFVAFLCSTMNGYDGS